MNDSISQAIQGIPLNYYIWLSTALFVIGVLGNNPFGDYLQQVVNGESWKSHPIVV